MIEIINLSKKFRIWEDRPRDLKETVITYLRGKKRSYREIWALRDINFKINEGETVAFIGENGSGKSTLLKLLAGIYNPDEGRIISRGRVSTLLELGVGFHPDLTGEENIYLNGAMLGFNHEEMREKFEEIVSFSEIGDFVYSPIRTYSSGMLMRLGFSIATSVDPDILLVDEILAVGDEAFQKKCFDHMERFKGKSKTIILVSHSMELVQKFCNRAILLRKGRVAEDGLPDSVIERYHHILFPERVTSHQLEEKKSIELPDLMREKAIIGEEKLNEINFKKESEEFPSKIKMIEGPLPHRYGTFEAEIVEVSVKNKEGEEVHLVTSNEMISFQLLIRFHKPIEEPTVGILIMSFEDGNGVEIYATNTLWKRMKFGKFEQGERARFYFVQRLNLPEGKYYLTTAVANTEGTIFYDWQENVNSFQIQVADSDWKGKINLHSEFFITRLDE